MSDAPSFTIPPDAVRVWRGFRASTITQDAFLQRLNTVFVPATVEMQIPMGLDAYIPSVPGGLPNKPDTVPDETAILFWDSQQTYTDGFDVLAVRTYTLTHGACYTPESGANFPTLFTGTLTANQPCYLVNHSADWMKGAVTHLVGSRPQTVTPAAFQVQIAAALAAIQANGGIAGAIACAGDDYLVYWVLAGANSAIADASVAALTKLVDWRHRAQAVPTTLEYGLWDVWPGMNIVSGDSLNMQFARRWEDCADDVDADDDYDEDAA